MRELELAVYVRRRMLAALLALADPADSPRLSRPLLGGLLVSAVLVAVAVGRRTW